MAGVQFALALAVVGNLMVGFFSRQGGRAGKAKGVGWQLIRHTVLGTTLPITAILALNGVLAGEAAAAIIAAAMSYAFAKLEPPKTTSPEQSNAA